MPMDASESLTSSQTPQWNLIDWDKAIEIGIPAIDTGNRILCQDYNTFVTMIGCGETALATAFGLNILNNYARRDLATEELFLNEIGYYSLDEHIRDHKSVKERLHQIQEALNSSTLEPTSLLVLFQDILLRHLSHNADIVDFITNVAPKCETIQKPASDGPDDLKPQIRPEAVSPIHSDSICRISKRFEVSLACRVRTSHGREIQAMLINLSQDGAKLGNVTGLFRGMSGILSVSLPPDLDLPFSVVAAIGRQASIKFNLTYHLRATLVNAFRRRTVQYRATDPDGFVHNESWTTCDSAGDIGGTAGGSIGGTMDSPA